MGGSSSSQSSSYQGSAGKKGEFADAAAPSRSISKDWSPRDRLAFEAKEMVRQIREKEDTLDKLRPTPKKSRFPQDPDLKRMTEQQLQDISATLEKELEDLDHEEMTLMSETPMCSMRRAVSKATAVSALSGLAASSKPPGGPGGGDRGRGRGPASPSRLTPEEQEQLDDPLTLLSEDFEYGLQWNKTFVGTPMGPKDESLRRTRREGTKTKVAQELGLTAFGDSAYTARRNQATDLNVFIDRTPASKIGNAPAGGKYLLGRYDVIAFKATADFDRNFEFIKGHKKGFFIANAAALNIGESTKAHDFSDFAGSGNAAWSLEEGSFFEAMEHIMANITTAAKTLNIRELVFFPFGMGAFLRHLGKLDYKFTAQEEMQRLRRRIARCFIRILSRTPANMSIHLCLMFGDQESLCNADAFLRALSDTCAEGLRRRVIIHAEGESLHLAQKLAMTSPNVMLVNGANRCLLGNHWFAGRAKLAIDENLHRRSWRMAATSYLVNGFGSPQCSGDRDPDDLQQNTKWLGGHIHFIDKAEI